MLSHRHGYQRIDPDAYGRTFTSWWSEILFCLLSYGGKLPAECHWRRLWTAARNRCWTKLKLGRSLEEHSPYHEIFWRMTIKDNANFHLFMKGLYQFQQLCGTAYFLQYFLPEETVLHTDRVEGLVLINECDHWERKPPGASGYTRGFTVLLKRP